MLNFADGPGSRLPARSDLAVEIAAARFPLLRPFLASIASFGALASEAASTDPVVSASALALLVENSPTTLTDFSSERLEVTGDLRLRQEWSFDLPGAPDRSRQRLRLRVAARYAVDDELSVGARVVTGSRDDPNSPNATLGDGLDGLELSLDRAFLEWRPESTPGTKLTAGKFAHPFYVNPVYGELVWDADVQPEGLVLQQACDDTGVVVVLGGYALVEQGSAADAFAVVSQVAWRSALGSDTTATIAAGYYHYTDATPDGSQLLLGDNGGNATVDTNMDMVADDFASDFGIGNAIVGVECAGWSQPVVFAGEVIHNRRAVGGQDDGWALGVAVGRSNAPGDWKFEYQLSDVERDAVFSPFAQDDFLFMTGHTSHLIAVNRQLAEGVGVRLWGLASAPNDDPLDDDNRWRVRLDINVSF